MVWHIDYNAAVSFSLLKCKYRHFIIYSPVYRTQANLYIFDQNTTGMLSMKTFHLNKQYASKILNFPIIYEVSETGKNSTWNFLIFTE